MKSKKKFFIKFVSKILSIDEEDIMNGEFVDNEVVNDTYTGKHRRVDLVFRVNDEYLINLEGNNRGYTGLISRNNSYIYRLTIDDKRRNYNNITKNVIQINIDNFKLDFNKKLINRFRTFEEDTKEVLPFTPYIVHISLAYLDNEDYTKGIDEWLLKVLRLFNAQSEREYKEIIGNDHSLMGVMEFMKSYSSDRNILSEYNSEIDEAMAREIDLKDAKNDGIRNEKISTVKNMLKLNMDLSTISKVTGLSLEDIKKIK